MEICANYGKICYNPVLNYLKSFRVISYIIKEEQKKKMNSASPLNLSQESIEFSSENPVSIFGSQTNVRNNEINHKSSTFKPIPDDNICPINTTKILDQMSPSQSNFNSNLNIMAENEAKDSNEGNNQLKIAEFDPNDKQNKRFLQEQNQFHPTSYKFNKGRYNFKQDMFQEQFIKNNRVNKEKIYQHMVSHTYRQVLEKFKAAKEEGNFPEGQEENELLWGGLLMRTKKMQAIFAHFTDEIEAVLHNEINKNGQFISEWVKFPHKANLLQPFLASSPTQLEHSQTQPQSQSLSPTRNSPKMKYLEQMAGPEPWFPTNLPVNKKLRTVYMQTKDNLRDLRDKNRAKKIELLEEKAREVAKMENHKRIGEQILKKIKISSKDLNLNKIKTKESTKKQKKNLMTPIQETISAHLSVIDEKIESLDLNTEEIYEEVVTTQEELFNSQKERAGKQPGAKIHALLQKWSEEPVETSDKLMEYANELWVTAEQFQKSLKAQQSLLELELLSVKQQTRTRVDGIRNQCAFRIEALESALIDVKMKYARERERAEMTQNEMESYLLNNQVGDNEMDNKLNDTLDTLNDISGLDEDQQVKMYQKVVVTQQKVIAGLRGDKRSEVDRNQRLSLRLERDKQFCENAQIEVKKSQQKVLFYQQIIFDVLNRSGIFDKDSAGNSKATQADSILFQEIRELRQDQKAQDKEDEETLREPDPKKKVQRLTKFVEDVHTIFTNLDVENVFIKYQLVVEQQSKKIKAVQNEMVNMGLLPGNMSSDASGKPSRIQSQSAITAGMPRNPRFSLKKKPSLLGVQNQSANKIQPETPIQKNEPQKAASLPRSLAEQKQESSQSVASVGRANALDKLKNLFSDLQPNVVDQIQGLLDEERKANEGSKRKKKKVKNGGSIEEGLSLLSDISESDDDSVSGAGGDSVTNGTGSQRMTKREQKKQALIEKALASQAKKAQKREAEERKAALKAKKEEARLAKIAAKKEKARLKREEERAAAGSGTAGAKKQKPSQSKVFESSFQNETSLEKDSMRSDDRSNSIDKLSDQSKKQRQRVRMKPRSSQALVTRHVSKKIVVQDIETNQEPSDKKSVASMLSVDQSQKPKTEAGRPGSQASNASKGGNRYGKSSFIKDIQRQKSNVSIDKVKEEPKTLMQQLEEATMNRYTAEKEIIEIEQVQNDVNFKLKTEQFENLYQTFKNSIGKELTNKDYVQLLEHSNFEDFINELNNRQASHFRENSQQIQDKLGDQIKNQADFERKIPIMDCICTEISKNGNFQGFKIRQDMAKIVKYRDQNNLSFIQKIIKTVNFLNRLILEEQNDYELGMKRLKVQSEEFGCQTEEQGEQKKSEEIKQIVIQAPDENSQELLKALQSCSIDILTRESPDQKSYYKLVWKNQTMKELLEYRLDNVFAEIPANGFSDDEDRIESQLTVLQLFQQIFSKLGKKLREKVPASMKSELSIDYLTMGCQHTPEWIQAEVQTRMAAQPKEQSVLSQIKRQTKAGIARGSQTDKVQISENQTMSSSLKEPLMRKIIQTGQSIRKTVTLDSSQQTGPELLTSLIEMSNQKRAEIISNRQIDEAMSKEMRKTIETMQSFMELTKVREIAEKNYKMNSQGQQLLIQDDSMGQRSKMVGYSSTQSSANNVHPLNNKEQLRVFRETLTDSKNRLETEIDFMRNPKGHSVSKRLSNQSLNWNFMENSTVPASLLKKDRLLPQLRESIYARNRKDHSVSVTDTEFNTVSALQKRKRNKRNQMAHMSFMSPQNQTHRSSANQNPFKQGSLNRKTKLVFSNPVSVRSSLQVKNNLQRQLYTNSRPNSGRQMPPDLVAFKLNQTSRENQGFIKTLESQRLSPNDSIYVQGEDQLDVRDNQAKEARNISYDDSSEPISLQNEQKNVKFQTNPPIISITNLQTQKKNVRYSQNLSSSEFKEFFVKPKVPALGLDQVPKGLFTKHEHRREGSSPGRMVVSSALKKQPQRLESDDLNEDLEFDTRNTLQGFSHAIASYESSEGGKIKHKKSHLITVSSIGALQAQNSD